MRNRTYLEPIWMTSATDNTERKTVPPQEAQSLLTIVIGNLLHLAITELIYSQFIYFFVVIICMDTIVTINYCG